MYTFTYLFVYAFINLNIYLLMYLLIYLFVYLLIYLFSHIFHLIINPFTYSFIYLFINLIINSFRSKSHGCDQNEGFPAFTRNFQGNRPRALCCDLWYETHRFPSFTKMYSTWMNEKWFVRTSPFSSLRF